MHQTSGRHAVISRWQGAGSGAQLKSNEWLRRDSREGCQDEQHGGKDAGGVPHCRLLIHWLWLSAGGECLCLYNVPRRPPALLALSLPLTPGAEFAHTSTAGLPPDEYESRFARRAIRRNAKAAGKNKISIWIPWAQNRDPYQFLVYRKTKITLPLNFWITRPVGLCHELIIT